MSGISIYGHHTGPGVPGGGAPEAGQHAELGSANGTGPLPIGECDLFGRAGAIKLARSGRDGHSAYLLHQAGGPSRSFAAAK